MRIVPALPCTDLCRPAARQIGSDADGWPESIPHIRLPPQVSALATHISPCRPQSALHPNAPSPSGIFFTARHGIGSMKCASVIFLWTTTHHALRFSKLVGDILGEIPEDEEPQSKYECYI
jgi:hypothetical protein